MQRIKILFFIIPLILLFNSFQDDMKKNNVLFCYGKMKPENVKGYKYVIVESKHYFPSNIRVMKAQNSKVLAYISLGEVNAAAIHYEDLKKHTLGKNKIWNSYYLNLKSKKTQEILMTMIDELFDKGYDGLFLDNFDNFTIHGPQKEQKEYIVSFMKAIKEKYPKKIFIQNAGLDLVSETSKYVDAVAIESVATDYSFKTKKYALRDKGEFVSHLNRINAINKAYNVPMILIEYADNSKLVEQIENRIDTTNYNYFIGKIDLQTIPEYKD